MNSQDEKPRGSARQPVVQPAPNRKEYSPPRLVVYGDLTALTAGTGNDSPMDGIFGSRVTT